ncbi:MAG: nicotinate (nicotinamide) nucleotide adenylyltransferase [Crocinitomicaceae bacterium]|nr:nicotinate (nicotinamide) nucleotide adenylyltransferase [Crocinitomicaceae bacterium]
MNIGLYFGTFNPIHVGHLVIANYMADFTDLDQVWLVVTPQNPLKNKRTLLKDVHRLLLVKEAINDNFKLKASDIEFDLPKPSYTIKTLNKFIEKYPKNDFSLIMGEDNLRNFHKWFNYEVILKNHSIYVYPRLLTKQEEAEIKDFDVSKTSSFYNNKNVVFCEDVPVMKISASFIRKSIKEGKDVRYLLTEPVHKYIEEMHFYK